MDIYVALPSDLQKMIDKMVHEMEFSSVLDMIKNTSNDEISYDVLRNNKHLTRTPFYWIYLARTKAIPREIARLAIEYEKQKDHIEKARRERKLLNSMPSREFIDPPTTRVIKSRKHRGRMTFVLNKQKKKSRKKWDLPRSRRPAI